jgi:hypothetical protein
MIRFIHQLMQEYFAAVHFNRLYSGRVPDRLESKWSEVVIALAGIAAEPEETIRDLFKSDPYLAGRCVASGIAVSDEIHQRIIQELNQELESSIEPIKRRERQRLEPMSRSSQMRMEDAIDDYFGRHIDDIGELLRRIQVARRAR